MTADEATGCAKSCCAAAAGDWDLEDRLHRAYPRSRQCALDGIGLQWPVPQFDNTIALASHTGEARVAGRANEVADVVATHLILRVEDAGA